MVCTRVKLDRAFRERESCPWLIPLLPPTYFSLLSFRAHKTILPTCDEVYYEWQKLIFNTSVHRGGESFLKLIPTATKSKYFEASSKEKGPSFEGRTRCYNTRGDVISSTLHPSLVSLVGFPFIQSFLSSAFWSSTMHIYNWLGLETIAAIIS